MQSQKWQNDLCSFPGKPFSITVIQVYAPTTNAKEWMILWRPIRPSRTNTKKRCPFHQRGLKWKSRKSSDTWNNTQVWPWSTKWSRVKANRVLPQRHTGHSKHSLSTTLEMALYMDITRWSILISGWLYSLQLNMEKLYTVSKNKIRSWVWLRSWTSYYKIYGQRTKILFCT